MTATLTDDELLGVLRQALEAAERDMADAARRCQRYGAALDVLDARTAPADPTVVSQRPGVVLDEMRKRDRERKRRQRAAAKTPEPDLTLAGAAEKYDRAEVARIARQAHADGRPMGNAVADALSVSGAMGQWLIADARRKGHDIPRRGDKPSPLGPIGKLPVDEEAARDAAGGPSETIGDTHGFGRPAAWRPTAADPTLTFSLDDARAAIAEAPL